MPRENPCGTRLSEGKMVTLNVFNSASVCVCVLLLRFVCGGLLRHIFPSSKLACRLSESVFRILCKHSAAAPRIRLAAPVLWEVHIYGSSCINRYSYSRCQTSDSRSPMAGNRILCHSWHSEK